MQPIIGLPESYDFAGENTYQAGVSYSKIIVFDRDVGPLVAVGPSHSSVLGALSV